MKKYVIWSREHCSWWAPNSMGYTTNIDRAGRYSEDQATQICEDANAHVRPGGSPEESMFEAPR